MPSEEPPALLHHSSLHCPLLGKQSANTTQYRGLQYATIPSRWAESTPLDTLLPNRKTKDLAFHDATPFGPSCPQKRGAQAWDLGLVGDDLVLEMEEGQGPSETMDEFNCLHVNVTVPILPAKEHRREDKGLPVFVWVHGGGLAMGSNSWPQYDLRRFVSRSADIGRPVIGVAINYRVGALGFLAASELGADGNLGFKDIVLGLQWVKRHIAGFGGDPANVTAAGESAGGIALSTILCSEAALGQGLEGLFARVVVMSGEVTLRKPRGRRWHEEMYREQLGHLEISSKTSESERVKTLKAWDAEEMCQKLPLAQHFCGYVDGKWLKDEVTLQTLQDGGTGTHKPPWLKEMVVGDMAHDGTILTARILSNPHVLTRLHILCTNYLTASETTALLTAYNLPPLPKALPPLGSLPSTPPDGLTARQSHALLELASELRFYLPALLVHQGWNSRFTSSSSRTKVSRYHFHVPNPFLGNFQNLASHELDVAIIFEHLIHVLSPDHLAISRRITDYFIAFVNGEGWAKDGDVVVFSPEGVKKMTEERYDRVWRGGRGSVLKRIGGEKLWKLAEGWQGVRSEDGGDERGESREGKRRRRNSDSRL